LTIAPQAVDCDACALDVDEAAEIARRSEAQHTNSESLNHGMVL